MQANECIYVPGMSLCFGVQADLAAAFGPDRQRHGARVVILSSDAPEWAMVALKPPCSNSHAAADLAGALAS
jgi:hypothetical protein